MAALAAARPDARDVLVPASLGALTLHARPEPSCLTHITFARTELLADRARFHASLLDRRGRSWPRRVISSPCACPEWRRSLSVVCSVVWAERHADA